MVVHAPNARAQASLPLPVVGHAGPGGGSSPLLANRLDFLQSMGAQLKLVHKALGFGSQHGTKHSAKAQQLLDGAPCSPPGSFLRTHGGPVQGGGKVKSFSVDATGGCAAAAAAVAQHVGTGKAVGTPRAAHFAHPSKADVGAAADGASGLGYSSPVPSSPRHKARSVGGGGGPVPLQQQRQQQQQLGGVRVSGNGHGHDSSRAAGVGTAAPGHGGGGQEVSTRWWPSGGPPEAGHCTAFVSPRVSTPGSTRSWLCTCQCAARRCLKIPAGTSGGGCMHMVLPSNTRGEPRVLREIEGPAGNQGAYRELRGLQGNEGPAENQGASRELRGLQGIKGLKGIKGTAGN